MALRQMLQNGKSMCKPTALATSYCTTQPDKAAAAVCWLAFPCQPTHAHVSVEEEVRLSLSDLGYAVRPVTHACLFGSKYLVHLQQKHVGIVGRARQGVQVNRHAHALGLPGKVVPLGCASAP